METSLHKELKEFYCEDPAAHEVTVDGYRIDAIVDDRLIEIQQASLAALRRKTHALLASHAVVIVKPLCAHKSIIRLKRQRGPVSSRRTSPRHETVYHLFQDLVHLVDVFPHPRLVLEVLLTEQEEIRVPKRKRWYRQKDYRVVDRKLIAVRSRHVFQSSADLSQLLPAGLEDSFTTADIARLAKIPRWLAQKMAYCLRRVGAITSTGKRRNSIVYSRVPPDRTAA
ncbi:MAG: hypothetical protein JSS02_28450 [Planctomycetes bacterium]|nr:hypothetical protein [Planctomycetota bacterium]